MKSAGSVNSATYCADSPPRAVTMATLARATIAASSNWSWASACSALMASFLCCAKPVRRNRCIAVVRVHASGVVVGVRWAVWCCSAGGAAGGMGDAECCFLASGAAGGVDVAEVCFLASRAAGGIGAKCCFLASGAARGCHWDRRFVGCGCVAVVSGMTETFMRFLASRAAGGLSAELCLLASCAASDRVSVNCFDNATAVKIFVCNGTASVR
jgi:hypothetical protein